MSTCILLTESGAFVLSTYLETSREDLPQIPQGFGGPPVEAYQLPETGYRPHRAVFRDLESLLPAVKRAIPPMPTAWEFSKVQPAGPPAGAIPLMPSDTYVMLTKCEEGFLLHSTVGLEGASPATVRVVLEAEQRVVEFEIDQATPARGVYYGFVEAGEVLAFLAEHLATA